ncbi:MAG: IclR family transcriptional regulator [Actinomycetes bacterium]
MGNSQAGPEPAAAGVQSVDRALTILVLLAARGSLGVTEVAAELGVHKSTAFRLLGTLEAHDLVEQNTERGKYRLGIGILRLAGATTGRLDLVQESRPVCRELAESVGETVNVTVLAGHEALYLDQVAGTSALQPHNWVGQRIPLHATSNGKVLLAHAPTAVFDDVVAAGLRRLTPRTVTDAAALRAELDLVTDRGWAVAIDELEVGLTAVAAPIRGALGAVVASVSASGPTFRLPGDRIPGVAALVAQAADEISRRLGWAGAPAPEQPVLAAD